MHTRRAGARTALVVALQALLIAAVGVALGLRDLNNRGERVRLTYTPAATSSDPKSPPGDTPPGGDDGRTSPTPTEPGPGQKPPEPAATPPAPHPAAPAHAGTDTDFTPSTEADLADKPGHITIDRARALMDQGALVLDARPTEEYTAGHISGAQFAPLSAFRDGAPPRALTEFPKDMPVVVYCGGGEDCSASEDVMLLLLGEGFTNVQVLHDGYKGWSALGLPTSTGENP